MIASEKLRFQHVFRSHHVKGFLKFLQFGERLWKAPFSWRISVDKLEETSHIPECLASNYIIFWPSSRDLNFSVDGSVFSTDFLQRSVDRFL